MPQGRGGQLALPKSMEYNKRPKLMNSNNGGFGQTIKNKNQR